MHARTQTAANHPSGTSCAGSSLLPTSLTPKKPQTSRPRACNVLYGMLTRSRLFSSNKPAHSLSLSWLRPAEYWNSSAEERLLYPVTWAPPWPTVQGTNPASDSPHLILPQQTPRHPASSLQTLPVRTKQTTPTSVFLPLVYGFAQPISINLAS